MIKLTGLEGIVAAETEISLVDGENGHLVYRGNWAKDLAMNQSFEEVAYLLWYGQLPNVKQLEEFKDLLKDTREIPTYVQNIISECPIEMDMMAVLRTAISAMGTSTYSWKPTIEQAIELTAVLPTMIAFRTSQLEGRPINKPNRSLDHIANYLYMLTGKEPDPTQVRALSAYTILTMEHGMNASTFAARVIVSTQSDMVSAISGAIGAMKGPLHGGAPTEVIDMLDQIETIDRSESWLREKLEAGQRIMGFGHRVYKTQDPRAVALQEITSMLSGKDPWLDLANHVEKTAIRLLEEYKPGRRLYTNVEFYAAAILRSVNMSQELFTPTFTASRVVGWTAHVLEQVAHNRIFRPQSTYVGVKPNEVR